MEIVIFPLTTLVILIGLYFVGKGIREMREQKQNKRYAVNVFSGGSLLFLIAVMHIVNYVS